MDGSPALADELVHVARAIDDPAAFAALYDHYFPRVYNYVRYRVQDPVLSDDLTADVFERTLAHLDTYRPDRAPFGAWLFSIARHVITDHFRAQSRRRWLSFDGLHRQASPDPAPEQIAAANTVRARLLAAVGELPDRERDVLALKFAASLTNRQIAQLTGLSESNVGVILYRSLRRLRDQLQDILSDEER